MIIETVNHAGHPTYFDTEAVIAFKQGKQLQYASGENWRNWKIEVDATCIFGPWCYNRIYKWRVKPETIEVDVEIKTVVKIPAPFKGTVGENQEYYLVYKYQNVWYFDQFINCSWVELEENNYVYLDRETAQKAVDILNGKNGESK